ncbi:MAG: cell division protein [Gammaproteobacteria bacterium]|nr:cell division protein [Gammaproteobacteria bacterium]|tara:strand:- start:18859 stop:19851 length:993 start_codon:yes stop_codon:yes gene_type:complete
MASGKHRDNIKQQSKAAAKKSGNSIASRISNSFRNHQQVAVDSLDRLLASISGTLMIWIMIAIAMALPLFLLLFLQNLQQFGSDLDEASQISVFMNTTTEMPRLEQLRDELLGRSEIQNVEIISAETALQEFQASSGFGDILSGLDENPLPPVLLVTPLAQDAAVLQPLLASLQDYPEVDEVQFDLDWLQRLYGILNLAQRLTYMIGLLLALGVALVVGNTIKLAIENRRDEIVVVKLVGGTDAYVSRPFLYTGLWYGAGGGLIACVLILLAQLILQGPVSRLAGLYEGEFALVGLGISGFFMVLLLSAMLGWFGAWLSVLRHLRAIEPG